MYEINLINENRWQGVSVISYEPVYGVKEVVDKVQKQYKMVILSLRCFSEEEKAVLRNWMNEYEISYDEITNTNLKALAYIMK